MAEPATDRGTPPKPSLAAMIRNIFPVLMLIVLCLGFGLLSDRFLSVNNALIVMQQSAVLLVAARVLSPARSIMFSVFCATLEAKALVLSTAVWATSFVLWAAFSVFVPTVVTLPLLSTRQPVFDEPEACAHLSTASALAGSLVSVLVTSGERTVVVVVVVVAAPVWAKAPPTAVASKVASKVALSVFMEESLVRLF